jgi:hypothetical protein
MSEIKIELENLDGIATAEGEMDFSDLVVTADDSFSEGYIAFSIGLGSKFGRFLATKEHVREFFKALKDMSG